MASFEGDRHVPFRGSKNQTLNNYEASLAYERPQVIDSQKNSLKNAILFDTQYQNAIS